MTFTNKAAKELRERLEAFGIAGAGDIWALTFHSACVRILRRDIDKLGFSNDFTIYDTDDCKRVVKDILKEMDLDEKTFSPREVLDEGQPDFDPLLDPKCCWALRHPDFFPVEVNRADYEALLRVPGIGVVSAKRILVARRGGALRAEDLKKLGVVLKRAQYFLTCSGRSTAPLRLSLEGVRRNLTATERTSLPAGSLDQLSLFEPA